MFHIFLHFIVPGVVAGLFFRKRFWFAYLIMIVTMVVDMDHLLANPIYDPNRCSIGFHPLHTIIPIVFYFVACFIPKTRLIGLGLIIHMALDSIDCQVTNGVWYHITIPSAISLEKSISLSRYYHTNLTYEVSLS
ncbi:DUF6122 family protein [Pleionea sediminis]|uniref:DUF6122 family protein n=1 Tax=Pleionea sediminis TaxID=2569479 RepID=UPI001FEA668A|nr:DUF6122 family protein [Pleionea sediminis]